MLVFSMTSHIFFAQTADTYYQIILESKTTYSNIYNKSSINPDNIMGISEFSSVSQLYPIIKLKNDIGGIETVLQIEGDIKNENFEKTTRLSFQELYSQLSYNNKHYFIAGKKRLDWGAGQIWNPTNFHIQKDPFRTENRLEGILMLNYSYLFKNKSINFYVFPDKEHKDFSYALKYDFSNERVNAELSFVQYTKYQQFNGDMTFAGDWFVNYFEGAVRNYSKCLKVDIDGNIYNVSSSNLRKIWTEVVLGGSILFGKHVTLRYEYRYRDDYLNKKDIQTFKNYLPDNTIIYDPISISKHSIFGSIEYHDLYDKWLTSLRSYYDPWSKNLILSPYVMIKMNNFQMEFTTMFYNRALPIYNFQSSVLLVCFF
jgi:hypothetical protein